MFLHSLNNDLPKMFLYNHFWPAAVMMNYLSLQSQVSLKEKGLLPFVKNLPFICHPNFCTVVWQ